MTDTGHVIRLGVVGDLAAASAVFRRASLSNDGDRDALLAHPEHLILSVEGLSQGRTFVAEADGLVVGFATWRDDGGVVELEDLFVDPGWMRRGIAAALVGHVVELLRLRGADRVEVTGNSHAMGFYLAMGFSVCGTATTDFGQADRLVLRIG
jgi:GNAT superfamily N-acetyltransferase